jgi:hypothetical protein
MINIDDIRFMALKKLALIQFVLNIYQGFLASDLSVQSVYHQQMSVFLKEQNIFNVYMMHVDP